MLQHRQFLTETTMLLDGGLATELEAQGYDLNNPMWSAKLILENPQAIIDAHLAYLNAGAQCIISASYQATLAGFKTLGLTTTEAEQALILAVELARRAVDIFSQQNPNVVKPLVAASIGPYGAYLADGSEYHGNYQITDQGLIEFHQQRLLLLAATSADILACETIPSWPEAQVLANLISQQSKPAWLSFSCRDQGHLNDGTPITTVGQALADNEQVIALGINCTAPQFIEPLLKQLAKHSNKALVVYPNSGEHFQASTKTWHGTVNPEDCAQAAITWRDAGADIIGGCCRMGPAHIAAMAKALKR